MARGIILDKDVLRRMEQRQGVIEEILSTEKDYLEDIRALIRVCFKTSTPLDSSANVLLGL